MLIDTSGFFSLHDKAEKHNALAIGLYGKSRLRLTTNYVLAEYTALALIRGLSRKGCTGANRSKPKRNLHRRRSAW